MTSLESAARKINELRKNRRRTACMRNRTCQNDCSYCT